MANPAYEPQAPAANPEIATGMELFVDRLRAVQNRRAADQAEAEAEAAYKKHLDVGQSVPEFQITPDSPDSSWYTLLVGYNYRGGRVEEVRSERPDERVDRAHPFTGDHIAERVTNGSSGRRHEIVFVFSRLATAEEVAAEVPPDKVNSRLTWRRELEVPESSIDNLVIGPPEKPHSASPYWLGGKAVAQAVPPVEVPSLGGVAGTGRSLPH